MSDVVTQGQHSRRSTDVSRELDEVRLQLLGAIDAARGAEAERAVVEARVRELEHQHHMLEVERDELRREVERLTRDGRVRSRRLIGRVLRAVKRRLFHG